MKIRSAVLTDQAEIIALYERSQDATALPNPDLIPRSELGARLYSRSTLQRYVATEAGRIVGHALIERPNPEHIAAWPSNEHVKRTFRRFGGEDAGQQVTNLGEVSLFVFR